MSLHSSLAPPQYANPMEKRKSKLKKASKTRRARDQSLQKASTAFGAYKITSALVCRHVEGSEHIVCDADTSQLKNVVSTGFSGIDNRRRSKTVYTLEQLVGKESQFRFRLLRWDGRFVFPGSYLSRVSYLDDLVALCQSLTKLASLSEYSPGHLKMLNGRCYTFKPAPLWQTFDPNAPLVKASAAFIVAEPSSPYDAESPMAAVRCVPRTWSTPRVMQRSSTN